MLYHIFHISFIYNILIISIYFSTKFDKIRQNSTKFDKIRQNSTKFDKIRQNSTKFDKIRQNSTKFDKIRQNSTKFDKIRQNSTKFDKIRQNSTKFDKIFIPKIASNFREREREKKNNSIFKIELSFFSKNIFSHNFSPLNDIFMFCITSCHILSYKMHPDT